MLSSILWLLLAIIVVAWLFGAFVANLGGIVHLLLVLAAIILIYNLFVGMAGGRRGTTL